MGYRSEVCIGLTDDASRLFRTILDHIPEGHEIHALVNDASTMANQVWSDQHKKPEGDCEDKLYWDSIKWYEGFEDVDFIENFLSECLSEEEYRFVRIGEESDDVEERGEFYDSDIYVHRSISW